MSNCADAARLSPEERIRETAAILASAVLRLRGRDAMPWGIGPAKPDELPPAGLEVRSETVLSVHTG